MVRRFYSLVLTLLLVITSTAQVVTKNSLSVLKPGSTIGYALDFSHAVIMGMDENEFSNYEKDWLKDKPKVVSNFLNGINNKLDGIIIVAPSQETDYILKVSVRSVSTKGYMVCDAVVLDKDGKSLFVAEQVNGGKEPPISPGSKLAKMKVWATLTGRSLGSIIQSEYLNQ